jgi:hypothetical protein
MKAINFAIGQTVGKRTILSFAGMVNGRKHWRVACDCGNILQCLTQDVNRGRGCKLCCHKGARPYRKKRPFETNYNSLVQRAKHPVLITYDQFVEFTREKECHYCGTDIPWMEYRTRTPGNSGSASYLDRQDSRLPYQLGNIVVCCTRCNYGKNKLFTYKEWVEIAAVIRSWKQKEEV